MKKLLVVLLLVPTFSLNHSSYTYAQKAKAEFTLEEIIVTAERRESSAQDTPVAVSAWDESLIDEQNISGAQDLQMRMPSTFVGTSTVTIRGVGRSSGRLGIDPGVGFFSDGFYNSEGTSWLSDLWDVERIENVRGPQSTLYGRATIGGAINIIQKKPTKEWSGQLKVTFGNYERRDFQVAFGGPLPLIDNLYYRLALLDKWYGGHQKNILWDDEYQGTDDRWRVSLKLLYEPTDNLSFYFKYGVEDAKERPGATTIMDEWNTSDINIWFDDIDGGSYFQNQFYGVTMANPALKNKYEVAQNVPGHYSLDSAQVDLTTTLDMGNFTVKHLAFYRDWENNNISDYDDGPSWDASKILYIIQDRYEWSQELQVLYGGEDTLFSFIGGLYYFKRHANMHNDLLYLGDAYWEFMFPFEYPGLPGFTPSPKRSDYINTMYIDDISEAIYGQIDYSFTDTMAISVGLRYALDIKKGPDTLWYHMALPSAIFGVPGPIKNQAASEYFGYDVYYMHNNFPYLHTDASSHNQSWDEFLYNIGLDYKPTESTLFYIKFSRGFKPGGFSLGSVQEGEFDAEYCNAYEAGWKHFWMENRFATSLSGYYYDYEGLQMTAQLEHITMTYNAANSENYGIEFEGSGYFTQYLLASLTYSYMQTEFKEFDEQFDQYQPQKGYQDLNGNPLPWSPEHKVAVNATYTIPTNIGDFSSHALYFWQSKVYTSHFAIPERLADAYDRMDTEFMWNSPAYKWRVTLWIKNVMDETTITSQSLSGPSNNFYNTASFAPPRTFGIDISYKW